MGGGEQHGTPSEAQAAIAGSQHPASRITAPAASTATPTECRGATLSTAV
jgi:hypothetical protein